MTVHAKDFSPSASARWLNCTASVGFLRRLTQEAPLQEEYSPYAVEGSAAHKVSELMLRGFTVEMWKEPIYVAETDTVVCKGDVVLEETFGPIVPITNDMIGYCLDYVAYCHAIDGVRQTEVRVDFSKYVPEGFGTSDHIILTDDGVLHVIDLKYGKGVRVDAEGNTQALLYALGALLMYDILVDIHTVVVHIYQPRLDHVSVAEYSVEEIYTFAQEAEAAAKEALSDSAVFVPGEKQCRWCDAAPVCPALAEQALSTAVADFSGIDNTIKLLAVEGPESPDLSRRNPAELSPADIAVLLPFLPVIEAWCGSVKQYAETLLLNTNGDGLPGYKLVEGRSVRQWSSEAEAEELLRQLGLTEAEIFKASLISPTQAEKLVAKSQRGELETVVVKPPGKPTLAPANDRRLALNLKLGAEFCETAEQ